MTTKESSKYAKAVDFIGKTFNNGNLVITAIDSVDNTGKTLFRAVCKICSQDKELFPQEHFVCYKDLLTSGSLPCGCSKGHKWTEQQYLIRARRIAKERRYIIHGFAEKFKGCLTKLNAECLIDGYKWNPTLNNFIKHKKGCPSCAKVVKTSHSEAERLCIERCKTLNYKPIGFKSGHKNMYSKFTFVCLTHGEYSMSFASFVKKGCICPSCATINNANKQRLSEDLAIKNVIEACLDTKYSFIGFPQGYKNNRSDLEYFCPDHGIKRMRYGNFMQGRRCKDCAMQVTSANGYYEHRKQEPDFLYILNFNEKYIKVGRTFNLHNRTNQLASKAKCENTTLLHLFTASHQNVWDMEQFIHRELRKQGLDIIPDNWFSQETFTVSSLNIVLDIINNSSLEKII